MIFKLLDALDHMWINKEFLMGGKPVFIKECFDSNTQCILSIWDLLNGNGQLQFFQEFNNKYECNTKFLQYTKLPDSANPKYFVIKARNTGPLENEQYARNSFQSDDSIQIQLNNAKIRDFYGLLNNCLC